MAANSVTGVGPGASNGLHKCANQCGGCGCKCGEESEPTTARKRGCYKRLAVGQKTSYKGSSGRIGIQVC